MAIGPEDENTPLDELEQGKPDPKVADGPEDTSNIDDVDEDEGEPVDDAGEDDDHPEGEMAPAAKGRLAERTRRLANERREATLKAERLERELAETRARQAQEQSWQHQQQQQLRAEQEWLNSPDRTPEERAAYGLNKELAGIKQQLQATQYQQQDSTDRIRFEAKAEVNPTFKRYADAVAREHANLLRNGSLVPRESILAYLIGQDVMKRGPKAAASQKRAAAAETRRQTVRPTNGRGDSTGNRRSTTRSFEDKFGDVPI
jgi:hypothetical protein